MSRIEVETEASGASGPPSHLATQSPNHPVQTGNGNKDNEGGDDLDGGDAWEEEGKQEGRWITPHPEVGPSNHPATQPPSHLSSHLATSHPTAQPPNYPAT